MEITETNNQPDPHNQGETSNLGDIERWGSIIGGSALVLMGLKQGSLRGVLTAIAGGGLVYHGATSQSSIQEKAGMNQTIKVEKTVTINKPAAELYRFWNNFENLPTFMKHLKSVQVLDQTRSHWIANAPLGSSVEWDAQIVNDQENKLIAWTSIEGAEIDNSGFVRFQPATGGRGTEVKVVIEYNPPGGGIAAAIAKLFGEEPEIQIGEDLHRFKQLMETGELPTNKGQPSGRK